MILNLSGPYIHLKNNQRRRFERNEPGEEELARTHPMKTYIERQRDSDEYMGGRGLNRQYVSFE